jgi:hypothetical protein
MVDTAHERGAYKLHVPVAGDVADVPSDFVALADTLTAALNQKLDKSDKAAPAPADVIGNYQRNIQIVQGTTPPSAAGRVENDIVFMIAPL